MDDERDGPEKDDMVELDGFDCPHLPEHRRHGTRRVDGKDVRVEECVSCGRVLVHPADADRVLSKRRPGKTQ